MGKSQDLLESLGNKLSFSRRGFVKGTVAMSAAAAVYGCSKDDDGEIIYAGGGSSEPSEDLTPDIVRYGTSGHNCGGKCLIKAHVKNGRIIRFLTDEHNVDANGTWVDEDNPNCSQSRACAKCRSYKFRLYHPGRLKYPLKQTKKRGDLSGFIRISWEEALNEISRKHKAIVDKYGVKSVFLNYACGAYSSGWQGGGYTGIWTGISNSAAGRLMGGFLPYTMDYSFHQNSFAGTRYTGYSGSAPNNNQVAGGAVKHIVLWGSNILSTVNPRAYSWIRSMEEMRKNGGKVHFIGPEFVDTGVTCADEWIQMKPYTDLAVVNAMAYHLITNTFDANGNIRTDVQENKRLDVNYLDSMVYGFFDSPEYWLKESDGTIEVDEPADLTGYRHVNAVPAGRSWSAYIMGSDDRLTKAAYSGNYMANRFAAKQPARNAGICSYPNSAGAATKYSRKADYLTPKTPEWAEKISGVPADKIREMAEMYVDPANHPIYNEWCGAQQKQAEGVINIIGVQSFLIITKTWGKSGDAYSRSGFAASQTAASGSVSVSQPSRTIPAVPAGPTISCVAWNVGVKFAFRDQLKAGGYTGKYVPDWDWDKDDGTERVVFMDDGGAKALVKWKYDTDGVTLLTDENGHYIPETDAGGKVIYSGIRFIMNPGGNILMNQHMNPNDAREMFECLSIASSNPDDPDTLCIVAFDNFLSPTPRWSDYILPAATNWEQEDIINVTMGNGVYIPVVSAPPGQSKSMWNFTNELLKAYEKVDTSKAGIARIFTGGVENQQIEDLVKKAFATASVNSASPYYRKTWEEFLSNTYLPRSANAFAPTSDITYSQLWTNLESYLASADTATAGFVNSGRNYNSTASNTAAGAFGGQYSDAVAATAPKGSMRFHVYSDMLVWQYENRYEKWHGYLPENKRGQASIDFEGDPLVYPIPMYYAYEDYFKEAYGVMNGKHELPDKPILVTTTHDRYRAHSSMAENPYLRELTHRTKGGALYSGNDWNEYALIGEGKEGETFPRLNKAIQENQPTASWSEIWINDEDAAERGIADGDLVLVQNPIGAVRCTARITKRCVKGMAGLHQGCWYDPAEDGVDDGGCCNTLMASRPSRVDHGNGQQSAMVAITKVN